MTYDKEFLDKLFSMVDFNSILIVDKNGKIQRIYCPFRVIAMLNFPKIKKDQVVTVDSIRITLELEVLYMIRGEAYLLRFFKVIF